MLAFALAAATLSAAPLTANALGINDGSGIVVAAKGPATVGASASYEAVVNIDASAAKGVTAAQKPMHFDARELGSAATTNIYKSSTVGRIEYSQASMVANKTVVYTVYLKDYTILKRYAISFNATGEPVSYVDATNKSLVNVAVEGQGSVAASYMTQEGYWPEPVTTTPVASWPYAASTDHFWYNLSLVATAEAGSAFAGWYRGDELVSLAAEVNSGSYSQLDLSGDVALTAKFVEDKGIASIAMSYAEAADSLHWEGDAYGSWEGGEFAAAAKTSLTLPLADASLDSNGVANFTVTVPFELDGKDVSFSAPRLNYLTQNTWLLTGAGIGLGVATEDNSYDWPNVLSGFSYTNNYDSPADTGGLLTARFDHFDNDAFYGITLGAATSKHIYTFTDSHSDNAPIYRVTVEREQNPGLHVAINGIRYFDGSEATIAAPLAKASITAPGATKAISIKNAEGKNAAADIKAGTYTVTATKVTGSGKNAVTETCTVTITVTKAIESIVITDSAANWASGSKTNIFFRYNATVNYTDGSKEVVKETKENILTDTNFDKTNGKAVQRDTVEYFKHHQLTQIDASIDVTATLSNVEGDGKTIAVSGAAGALCDLSDNSSWYNHTYPLKPVKNAVFNKATIGYTAGDASSTISIDRATIDAAMLDNVSVTTITLPESTAGQDVCFSMPTIWAENQGPFVSYTDHSYEVYAHTVLGDLGTTIAGATYKDHNARPWAWNAAYDSEADLWAHSPMSDVSGWPPVVDAVMTADTNELVFFFEYRQGGSEPQFYLVVKRPEAPISDAAGLADALAQADGQPVDLGGSTVDLGGGQVFAVNSDTQLANGTLNNTQYGLAQAAADDITISLSDVNISSSYSCVYLENVDRNTVNISGGSFKGSPGSGIGIFTSLRKGDSSYGFNNTFNISNATIEITGANKFFVWLSGSGNKVNFTDCTFIVNGTEVSGKAALSAYLKTEAPPSGMAKNQVFVNGVLYKS